jgi:hypothetical protein
VRWNGRLFEAATAVPYGSPIVSRFRPQDLLDRVFETGIILKGLDGVLETIGGVLLLAVTPTTINTVVSGLTQPAMRGSPPSQSRTQDPRRLSAGSPDAAP